jgi:FkbM family methyltransferase
LIAFSIDVPTEIDLSVNGVRLRCRTHDNWTEDGLVFGMDGEDQSDLVAYLSRIQPGDIVCDVGANCGLHALLAAKVAERVIAIEPNRALIDRLLFNVNANRFTNVSVIATAIGDHVGTGTLHIPFYNAGAASLVPFDDPADTVSVPIRPLTQVLLDCKAPRIDVLKVDIEGYEDRALLPLLADQAYRPRMVMLEACHRDKWADDACAALLDAEYREAWRGRFDVIYEDAWIS